MSYEYEPLDPSCVHWSRGITSCWLEPVHDWLVAYTVSVMPLAPHTATADPPLDRDRHEFWGNVWPEQPSWHVESGHEYCVKLPDAGAGGVVGDGGDGGVVGVGGAGGLVGFGPDAATDVDGLLFKRHWFVPFCTRM